MIHANRGAVCWVSDGVLVRTPPGGLPAAIPRSDEGHLHSVAATDTGCLVAVAHSSGYEIREYSESAVRVLQRHRSPGFVTSFGESLYWSYRGRTTGDFAGEVWSRTSCSARLASGRGYVRLSAGGLGVFALIGPNLEGPYRVERLQPECATCTE